MDDVPHKTITHAMLGFVDDVPHKTITHAMLGTYAIRWPPMIQCATTPDIVRCHSS